MSNSPASWQTQLATAFTSASQLLSHLELDAASDKLCNQAAKDFPLLVTRSYAECMKKGDINDPLLRQVLPLAEEGLIVAGFSADPVGDNAALVAPGVLHKYRGRALLIATAACAIHCRYCFRRNFPYAAVQLRKSQETAALDYLRGDSSIKEVILSGGDPLLLSDQHLINLLQQLADIPHLQRVRLHSRVPLVLPARITPELVALLVGTRLKSVLVIHANHAQEIGAAALAALSLLRSAPITLLNQTVLLRGVNDNLTALFELSETLFQHGVLPYYLHLLDKANGTAHFDVPLLEALKLYASLRNNLPGYLLPRMVREQRGQAAKLPVEAFS